MWYAVKMMEEKGCYTRAKQESSPFPPFTPLLLT